MKSAAELWLKMVQSLTSNFLDSVPLNPIRSLETVSDAGTNFGLWFRLTARGWGSLPGSVYNVYIRIVRRSVAIVPRVSVDSSEV